MRTTGLIRALVSIIITGIAAGGCVTPNAAKVLKSIALTPSAPVLSIAAVQPLTATATFDDGSTEDVTTAVDWSSSDDTIANLSMASGSEGKVTALKPGTVTITATDALTKVFATTTLVVSP
ncbi:MAG: Ig-like domain-containing protein, partial [Deltaproteobacteria bacterium]|nr:Ig-like domain-containing protein [Deltaproteobacteria bacterium]